MNKKPSPAQAIAGLRSTLALYAGYTNEPETVLVNAASLIVAVETLDRLREALSELRSDPRTDKTTDAARAAQDLLEELL